VTTIDVGINASPIVMAGLVPAIRVLATEKKGVDAKVRTTPKRLRGAFDIGPAKLQRRR
jgi:hypothetical protein